MDFGKLASGLLSGNKKGDQSQGSGSGFDINQATSLASGFLGSKGGNQSTGGFDIGQASALASKFLGGNSTNNNDLFSSALKMATGNTGFNKGDADHDTIKDSYNKVNSGSDLKNKAEQTLGMASAYMAFQKFQGKGGSQNELVAMAMSQAQKMYASHSNNSGVNQQETLATAAQAAMKLFGSK